MPPSDMWQWAVGALTDARQPYHFLVDRNLPGTAGQRMAPDESGALFRSLMRLLRFREFCAVMLWRQAPTCAAACR